MKQEILNRISVIVPSLNPDEKLVNTVNSLLSVGFTDIICVNDGSREECLRYFPSENENIVLLTHTVNRGKGAALKTAFAYLRDNRPNSLGAITVDGDGQHAAHDVLRCAEQMIADYDKVVLGCRDFSEPQVPKRSRYGNRITSGVFRVLCNMKFSDTQTGLRAFPAKYYTDMLEVSGDRFEYETNMLLEMKARKIPYSEVKIETVYIEENHTSHFRPFKDSYRIYSLILKFTFGQFFRFALSSLASFALEMLLLFILLKMIGGIFEIDFAVKTAAVAVWTGGAQAVARIFSSVFNFAVNRKKVFSADVPLGKSLFRYYCIAIPHLIVSATALALLELIPIFNSEFMITLLAAAINCALYFLSYFFQKKWVFGMKNS